MREGPDQAVLVRERAIPDFLVVLRKRAIPDLLVVLRKVTIPDIPVLLAALPAQGTVFLVDLLRAREERRRMLLIHYARAKSGRWNRARTLLRDVQESHFWDQLLHRYDCVAAKSKRAIGDTITTQRVVLH